MNNQEQQVQSASDAEQILSNPAYKFAIEQMRIEIFNAWKDCPVRDKEAQQLLLQRSKLADQFENILRGLIETGKLAANQLNIDRMRNETRLDAIKRKVFR